MQPVPDLALLTTHFGDPFWVALLVARVRQVFPELPDTRIFVVDQDRTESSAVRLRARLGDVRILHYERSEPHVVMTGHDHAHVLNEAVREIDVPYVMLFDSDAHPVGPRARDVLLELATGADATLAALGPSGVRTHPCFMIFGPAVDREQLRFDEGQLEVGVDTGRLIHDQIASPGVRVQLLRPEPVFGGRWGTMYGGGTIYHHGSGSFGHAADPRLRRQAALFRDENLFYRRRVGSGRYALSPVERAVADALRARRTLPARAGAAARRLRRLAGRARRR